MSDQVNEISVGIEATGDATSKVEELDKALDGVKETAEKLVNSFTKLEVAESIFNGLSEKVKQASDEGQGLENLDFAKMVKSAQAAGDKVEKIKNSLSQIETPKMDTVAVDTTVSKTLEQASTEAGRLKMKIDSGTAKLKEMAVAGQTNTTAYNNLAATVGKASEKLTELSQRGREASQEGNFTGTKMSAEEAAAAVDKLNTTEGQLQDLQAQLDITKQKLAELFQAGATGENKQVQDLTAQMRKLQKQIDSTTKSQEKNANVSKKQGGAFAKLGAMAKRLLMYRVLSSIFRSVTNAMKEGTENAYQYSKAMGGTFATSMDNIKTGSTYLKNSLGALGSGFIRILEPVFVWLSNNLAEIFNFLSVVIAKISGETTALQAKSAFVEYAEATDKATQSNKDFKKSLAGFDELNNISSSASSAAQTQSGGSANVSDMFYDMDISKMSWGDVADMSGFEKTLDGLKDIGETIGTISAIFGKTKTSGIAFVISGVIGIVEDIKSIKTEGFTFDNVTNLISDLSEVAFGISVLRDNLTIMGITGAIKIVTDFVNQAPAIWKGIKEGDWSDVDVSKLVEDGLVAITFIAVAIHKFKKNKAVKNVADTASEASSAVEGVSTATSGFSSGLKKFAKNMLLVIAIIAEVIFAVGLFVAGIWGIGWLLQQVIVAWEPVIANKDTVNAAILQGGAILLIIGAACWALGELTLKSGGTIAKAIGVGMAILVEISAAADLFVGEVIILGKMLQEIVVAWTPVIQNGDTCDKAIEQASLILLAVGAACAVLGALTLKTGGTIAVAIGLGVAMLEEIAVAAKRFIHHVGVVATQLGDELAPAMDNFTQKTPNLENQLDDFNDKMIAVAVSASVMSGSTVLAGIADLVSDIVSFFTGDPVENLAKSAKKNGDQAITLNSNLKKANPELKTTTGLLADYNKLLDKIADLTDKSQSINITNLKENMKNVGKNLVTGLAEGLKSKKSDLNNALKEVLNDVFNTDTANSYGEAFGKALAKGVSNGFKNANFPKLSGTISTKANNKVELTMKAYAMGGFVDSGEMFIAREAGPELVGTIGNRTAVANQDQIVSAVSLGVYNAVVDAMTKTNSQNSDRPISVVINGREVFKTVQSESNAYRKRTGQPAF